MDYGVYQYDDPYSRPRRKRVNYFAWTLAILLLTGLAFAAWLGSFYIFDQPERPDSYRILQRLHKIDPPKRFELTAAPAGEFQNAKQLYDRYVAMGSAELAKANAELARNYIRNYGHVRGLVPYVIGRYTIMEARELGSRDVFTSGMVALAGAVDHGELLIEHLYPANPQAIPLMKQTLNPGLEIKFERVHDLSAVIHAERLEDGRIMITAMPLLYGTYTMTRGPGTFTLEPPLNLNLEAGWPLFKEQSRLRAELHYKNYRQEMGIAQGPVPIPGFSPSGTPPPAGNELVRVEPAKAVETPAMVHVARKNEKVAKATPTPKGGKLAKKQKIASPSPLPAASVPAQPVVAEKPAEPIPTAAAVAVATPPPAPPQPPIATPAPTAAPLKVVAASPPPTATAAPTASVLPKLAAASIPPKVAADSPPPKVAAASPPPIETPVPVLPAQPVPGGALASTAGGGSWKTFPPGRMPLGRLVSTGDLRDVAEHGLAGERVYLRGQFVVNFSDANRAVLRPRKGLADTVLHFGSPTRIIVEFPAGYNPPRQGAIVSRDEARPYEITEVRKQEDGQLNVFVREIMQPN